MCEKAHIQMLSVIAVAEAASQKTVILARARLSRCGTPDATSVRRPMTLL
jgi:hypothetical protein